MANKMPICFKDVIYVYVLKPISTVEEAIFISQNSKLHIVENGLLALQPMNLSMVRSNILHVANYYGIDGWTRKAIYILNVKQKIKLIITYNSYQY